MYPTEKSLTSASSSASGSDILTRLTSVIIGNHHNHLKATMTKISSVYYEYAFLKYFRPNNFGCWTFGASLLICIIILYYYTTEVLGCICPLWFRWMLCLLVMASCFPGLILLGRVTQGYAMWRFMGQRELQWQALAERLLGQSSWVDTNAAECSQDPFFSQYMGHFIRVCGFSVGEATLKLRLCTAQTAYNLNYSQATFLKKLFAILYTRTVKLFKEAIFYIDLHCNSLTI